jgi:cbb3-type cytochrome oxidase subunit 3
MFREFLARSSHLDWPLVALVLFFGVFLGVLVLLGWSIVRRKTFDDVASLPLEDDEDVEREKGGFKA